MKIETGMLNRSGSHRVVLRDGDGQDYYGLPAKTRAGRFRSPLAWAAAAARVCWATVAGHDVEVPDDRDAEHDAGPLETR